jgi:cytochrome d ubiquinol oxidase subunit I
MIVASFETSVFVVAGLSAYFLLRRREVDFFRRSLGIALVMAALFSPLQIILGDASGRQVFQHQPAKLAAMEAHWETNTHIGAPFALIALPDMKGELNHSEIAIPNGLSLLVTHSSNGQVKGLKEFPREDRPNVFLLFWAFRSMVAIGFILFFVMVWGAYLWRRGRLFDHRSFLWTLLIVHPLGFLATELGWMTTEVGRQPWVVYHLMRTAEGVSPVPAGNVLWSLTLFLIILPVIGAIYFFYILKTLNRGPDLSTPIPPIQRPLTPSLSPAGRGRG